MNSERRAVALTATPTAVEALADAEGWDAYPALLGLIDTSTHTGRESLDVEELPIDTSVWQLHSIPGSRIRLPYWVGLSAITQSLTNEKVTELRSGTRAQRGPLVAMAFLGEGLDTSDAGRQAAAARGLPAEPDGIPVRALTAFDIDGRVHQTVRMRGAATTTTLVLNNPTSHMQTSIIPACLWRLLTAARA